MTTFGQPLTLTLTPAVTAPQAPVEPDPINEFLPRDFWDEVGFRPDPEPKKRRGGRRKVAGPPPLLLGVGFVVEIKPPEPELQAPAEDAEPALPVQPEAVTA